MGDIGTERREVEWQPLTEPAQPAPAPPVPAAPEPDRSPAPA
jgi:hypothetical protein